MTDASAVSEFVNEQGGYLTRRVEFSPGLSNVPDGCKLWETLLLPDGPRVFTLEHPDGRLEDVT